MTQATHEQPIRIGVDARCLEGERTGTGRYLQNLLPHLAAVPGVSLTLYIKHAIPEDLASRLGARVAWRRLLPLFGHESNALFTHWLLPRALARDKQDVLFAPYYVAPLWGRVPVALTLHDISYEAHPEWVPGRDRVLLRLASRLAARRAARILTISTFSRTEIMRLYGTAPERIIRIPLAADPALSGLVPSDGDTGALARLGVARPYLLTIGMNINRRYPRETLAAFVTIASQLPEPHSLVLVGGDRTFPALHLADAVRSANARLGRKAVRMLPHVADADLAALYRNARALVWLSAYEGFGLPPVEAQAAGIPVVTSRSSSLPEAVGEDGARYIDDPPSASDLARAMTDVVCTEEVRAALIAHGRAHVARRAWEDVAHETLQALREAAHG